MAEQAKAIWTGWGEYGATGEGSVLMVWIGYAVDEQNAREFFREQFGDFLGRCCTAERGIVRNRITDILVPAETADKIAKAEHRADIAFYAQMRVNAS
jgi:hypothetical protein